MDRAETKGTWRTLDRDIVASPCTCIGEVGVGMTEECVQIRRAVHRLIGRLEYNSNRVMRITKGVVQRSMECGEKWSREEGKKGHL